MRPLAIDLYCGLGGWAEGLLIEGYDVIGFDITAHVYGEHRYPAQLVVQDVLALHGSQFLNAALIVASPPCQEPSYRAMPWTRARALNEAGPPVEFIKLFNACFRLQREACEAAGRHIPLVVENVRGAQKWVGRARWNFGSYYLWGDVPALMPKAFRSKKYNPDRIDHDSKNNGGSWFRIAHNKESGTGNNPVSIEGGYKSSGLDWSNREQRGNDFTRVAGRQMAEAQKMPRLLHVRDGAPHTPHMTNPDEHAGTKQPGIGGARVNGKGDAWFQDGAAAFGSKSNSRKMASAMIAKIPLPLARHIGRCWYPPQLTVTGNPAMMSAGSSDCAIARTVPTGTGL